MDLRLRCGPQHEGTHQTPPARRTAQRDRLRSGASTCTNGQRHKRFAFIDLWKSFIADLKIHYAASTTPHPTIRGECADCGRLAEWSGAAARLRCCSSENAVARWGLGECGIYVGRAGRLTGPAVRCVTRVFNGLSGVAGEPAPALRRTKAGERVTTAGGHRANWRRLVRYQGGSRRTSS